MILGVCRSLLGFLWMTPGKRGLASVGGLAGHTQLLLPTVILPALVPFLLCHVLDNPFLLFPWVGVLRILQGQASVLALLHGAARRSGCVSRHGDLCSPGCLVSALLTRLLPQVLWKGRP